MSVTDKLLKDVAAIRSDGNILPLPAMTVTGHTLPEGGVVVVEVVPSDLPPVRYKGQVWIRVGPRQSIANETEERMLSSRRVASARSFDARPIAEAALSDLSLALFNAYRQYVVASDVIAANNRTEKEQLASLRFFDLDNDTPTAAGIILFGTNSRFFLPGHYVQYLRFPGDSMTDPPDDQAEISGDLLGLLRELDQRIRVDIQTRLRSTSMLREQVVPDYPEVAVRELMMNAIMHRDYQSTAPVRFYWFSDRIEIQNPGGLYGELTPETLRQRNSYRNPVIAEAMKSLGYVNRFGYGIQRADAALLANGNRPVEFTIDERVFAVTIRGVER